MKKDFEFWLRNIAKKSDGTNYREKTVIHYVSGIEAIKTEFNIDFWNISDVSDILDKKYKLQSNKEYIKKDIIGNKMYSCALEKLIDYIYFKSNNDIKRDIDKIESDYNLSLEEKDGFIESLINMRNPQFQRNFRKELIKEFNCKCALCDISDKRFLIASHIIPYSACNYKNDMYKAKNGLLLCVMHDYLFDKHLISFNIDGNIIIDSSVDTKYYNYLNINKSLKLDKKFLNKDRKKCLESHLKSFKNKNSKGV